MYRRRFLSAVEKEKIHKLFLLTVCDNVSELCKEEGIYVKYMQENGCVCLECVGA
jgi:hypothetical protein